MRARPPIYSCATETVEAILFNLDGHDVARATTVCRLWKAVVKGSAALQYKIQLALEGFVEDPAHLLPPLPDRVSTLQRYMSFWNRLVIDADAVRSLDAFSGSSIATSDCFPVGRWLVDYDDFDHPRIAALPPQNSGEVIWKDIPMRTSAHLSERMLSAIALQSLDMLVVFGEASEDGRIELLHAETLRPHPLVAHALLSWPPSAELGNILPHWTSVSLCGEVLAINFHFRDGPQTFAWNWRLGALMLGNYAPCPRLPGSLLTDVVLLAENAFCWAEYERGQDDSIFVVLVVNTLDASGVVRPRGRWAFPALMHDAHVSVDVQTDEADEINASLRTSAPYLLLNSPPFPAASGTGPVTDNIVALEMVREGVMAEDATWTFYMLRSTFLLGPPSSDPEMVVPWESWGPDNTRCIPGSVQSIHGCRVLHSEHADGGGTAPQRQMLTFVAAKCRAARLGVFTDDRDAVNFVDAASEMDLPPFCSSFVTSLPYFAARAASTADGQTAVTTIPGDCMCWCEDGRVAWTSDSDPNTLYIAIL